jgi:hypothetical protein
MTDVKVESEKVCTETDRNERSVSVDSEKDEWSSKQKKAHKTESKSALKKPNPDKASPAPSTTNGKAREKRRVIVEDSDDEDMPRVKRARNRPQMSDEEDLFDVEPSQARGAHTNTSDVDEDDMFDMDVSTQSKEQRRKSTSAKTSSRNSLHKAGGDTEQVCLSEGSPEKSTKMSPKKTALDRQKGRTDVGRRQEDDSRSVRMKEELPEVGQEDDSRSVRLKEELPEVGQEDDSRSVRLKEKLPEVGQEDDSRSVRLKEELQEVGQEDDNRSVRMKEEFPEVGCRRKSFQR